ncbi:hypothetical protein [Neptunicoccus sediminis]|uniref:hypothetical protein n=1 Tax=Neptunicoccus sediminis TaxID=1892596 RepID=UPI0012FFD1B3|nr:hypothetical protein [Neptunicoccus sediminis]
MVRSFFTAIFHIGRRKRRQVEGDRQVGVGAQCSVGSPPLYAEKSGSGAHLGAFRNSANTGGSLENDGRGSLGKADTLGALEL